MSIVTETRRNTMDAAAEKPVIVVGFDGSEESRRAVEVAAERAGPGGRVVPIYVTLAASNWLGASSYETVVEQTYEAAEVLLTELRKLDTGDAVLEPELTEGEPAEALLRVAQSRNAREIVVGSRGRGRFRSLLGSTSHALLESADRPVVIVPKGAVREHQ